ncbi:PspC domain-containing protein [Sphingomonas sp. LY29]|jgi:phage shock protein PspC (stress-responsive transcriptional regulator)|uniref:PspC domain-containing protein n=1 Tax=unclassified Sphingomonas TaxID=196159 RepID=UPI002ADEDD98|nr:MULTISPECIES: PspC domain-containing protein [unclassified Sphingomonas]MEA1072924.1 PspC domain-containing protein [Sphingomonas sp. LY160]WRP26778.1 PspC domain-containing protein [Sphingomonas sp. LY29]
MSLKTNYSLDRHDRKIAGVCSELGRRFSVDPTFLRIGFVALALFTEWEIAVVAYAAMAIYFFAQKKKAGSSERVSEYDKMGKVGEGRTSIHALRTELDENDRRMMAIDHHLNSQNDELAREIEALRSEK